MPDRTKNNDTFLWSRLNPVLFILLWSSGFTFVKMGLAYAQPMTLLVLRYVVVLAVLLPLFFVIRPTLPKTVVAWGHLTTVGLFVHTLYFGLVYVAIYLGVSAGGMGLIASLQPILVAVLAPRLAGVRINARQWAGLGLGLLGAALVIVSRLAVEATSILGILSAFGALAGLTTGTLYEKRFGVLLHPVASNLVQYTVGLILALCLAAAFEDAQVAWTGELFLSVGYLAFGNSLISTTLLLAMVRRGEALRVSMLFFLVPPTAALTAWTLLGETLPPLAWAGMALASVGVAVVVRSSSRSRVS